MKIITLEEKEFDKYAQKHKYRSIINLVHMAKL